MERAGRMESERVSGAGECKDCRVAPRAPGDAWPVISNEAPLQSSVCVSLRHSVQWRVQDSGFLRPGGRAEAERGEACGDGSCGWNWTQRFDSRRGAFGSVLVVSCLAVC